MKDQIDVDLPRLLEIDAEVSRLQDQMIALKGERKQLIDDEAQKIAAHSIGEETTKRKRRYRVTRISGEYHDYEWLPQPKVTVRYHGVCLFKNGNEGKEESIYFD